MKLKVIILLVLLFCFSVAQSQVLYIKNGLSVSKMNSKLSFLNKSIVNYSFFVGVGYNINKRYEIYTEIGRIVKGGKEYNESLKEKYQNVLLERNFLQFSTDLRVNFFLEEDLSIFIGLGPKLDFLLQKEHIKGLYKDYDINNVLYGIKTEIGTKILSLGNFDVGFSIDAHVDINHMLYTEFISIRNFMYQINFMLAYNF